MRKTIERLTVVGAALAVVAAGSGPAAADKSAAAAQTLGIPTAAIDAALEDAQLAGAFAGVVVRDAATGEVVYDRNGDRYFLPGSNQKLLVSAAALDILGPDYRFNTIVIPAGTRSGTTLTGNLVLKGTGDPTLSAASFDDLAARVAATGIKKITGSLVTDDTFFDNVRLGAEWSWGDEQFAFSSQISALTVAATPDFDTGAVTVKWAPAAKAGSPVVVTLDPPNTYVTVQNLAKTVAVGGAREVSVNRRHGSNTIVVSGTLPVGGAAGRDMRSVEEPAFYAGALFRAALAKRGVTIAKPTTIAGQAPAGTPWVTRQSPPLSALMPAFLKLSNNGHAEILLKTIGRKSANKGQAAVGVAAVNAFLQRSGVDQTKVRAFDGSGLSRVDLVSPRQVTALLANARSKPWFATWYAALPVAGNPNRMIGGTLAGRMGGTAAADNVHAKTGSMTSVSALSGYVTTASGQELVFSILLNQFIGLATPKSVENQIAVALANSGAPAAAVRRDLARLAPPRIAPNDPRTDIDESALECSWVKAC